MRINVVSNNEVAMEVPSTERHKENGLESLLKKLETVLVIDTVDAALISYDSFESIKRLLKRWQNKFKVLKWRTKKLKKQKIPNLYNILA